MIESQEQQTPSPSQQKSDILRDDKRRKVLNEVDKIQRELEKLSQRVKELKSEIVSQA